MTSLWTRSPLPRRRELRVARTAVTAGAVFAFFLGLAMGALVSLDQGLTIGDRNLIIVRVNFAEGEKAMTVAAVLDEGGLERWFYARDLGEVDIAAQLFALGGLEIKLFYAIAADHNDPGLFRVGASINILLGILGLLTAAGAYVGARVWRARVTRRST